MLKEMRDVSARSSNKLMGWCWKQMLLYVLCALQKWNKNTNNFKTSTLWMGGQERMTKSTCHGWTGNGSSFEALFPRFGSSVSSLFGTLTVVAGWSSGRNCWAPQKKIPFFSDTTKHPRYPWVDFNCCRNFEMFFDFEETDQQNTKKSIAIDTMPIIQVKVLVQLQADPTSIASNPGTQVSRSQGRFIVLLKNWFKTPIGTSMRVHPERLMAGTYKSPIFGKENDLKQISMMMFHINLQGCNHVMELRNFLMSSWVACEVMHKLNPIASMGLVYLHLHLP